MYRFLRILVLVVLLIGLMPDGRATAAALNTYAADDAAAITSALQSYGDRLAALGRFEELNEAVPLTGFTPGGAQALALQEVFEGLFDGLPALYDPTADPYGTLKTALESINAGSIPGLSVPGLVVAITNVTVADPEADRKVDVQFTLSISRDLTPPFQFAKDAVQLAGGAVPVHVALETTLAFVYDGSQPALADAFALNALAGPPALTVSAATSAPMNDFKTKLGIAAVEVSGSVSLALGITAALNDPDASGWITLNEVLNHQPIDLFSAEITTSPPSSASANLALALFLKPNPAAGDPPDLTGSLTVSDSSLADGFNPSVNITPATLDNFTNLNPDQLLTGIAQAAAGLIGSQYARDMRLPLINKYMGDIFEFARPVTDFIHQQGDADILCGTGLIEDRPDGILPSPFPAGTTIYCQAYASDLPRTGTVQWTLDGAPVSETNTGQPVEKTVGPAPVESIKLTAFSGDMQDIRVAFALESDDPADPLRSVTPRFETVQEMVTAMLALGGLTSVTPAFDPQTQALTYTLTYSKPSLASAGAELDFGSKLAELTSITGLSPVPDGDPATFGVSVTPADIEMGVTLGVLLGDAISEPTDRFFLQVDPTKGEFSANVDVSATVNLVGRLGFLEVSVTGDGSPDVFSISPINDSTPMVRVDIDAPGISYDGKTIANAIMAKDLLDNLINRVSATCKVNVHAGLEVSAKTTGGTNIASGGITVDWNDAFAANCVPNPDTLTVDGDDPQFLELKAFDLRPGLYGKYNPGSATPTEAEQRTQLIDSTRSSFPDYAVGATLSNVTDGSRCVISSTSGGTATCDAGLSGGVDNKWETGDRYEISGDPLVMLSAILANLEVVANGFESITGMSGSLSDFYKTDLPAVGVSLSDLMSQFRNLKEAVNEIRSGTPEAVITCYRYEGTDLVAGIEGVAEGEVIECKAVTSDLKDLESVQWSIGGEDPSIYAVPASPSNINDKDTIGANPSKNARFIVKLPGGVNFNAGFAVQVDFKDAEGERSARLPETNASPFSLQRLEAMLEDRLNIPASALDFEIGSVPRPGMTTLSDTKDLIVRLNYGICTDTPAGSTRLVDACDPSDRHVKALELPLSLDLGSSLPDIVGLEAETYLKLQYLARASLEFAIEISTTPNLYITENTGLEAQIGFGADDLRLKASLGPLSANAGKDVKRDGTLESITGSTLTVSNITALNEWDVRAGDEVKNLSATTRTGSEVVCKIQSISATDITCEALASPSDWLEDDQLQVGGRGSLTLGLGVEIGPTSTGTKTIANFLSDLDITVEASGAKAVDGRLSLELALGSASKYLGEVGFSIDEIDLADLPPELTVVDNNLFDRLGSTEFDWALLLKVLPELLTYVETNLNGAAAGISVPLVGDVLDAGADVAGFTARAFDQINTLVGPLLSSVPAAVSSVKQFEDFLAEEITDALGSNLLDGTDVVVTAYCGASLALCGDGADVELVEIYDLRVTFTLGDSATFTPMLNLGVPGVPIAASGGISAEVEWSLLVDFGINRTDGPYIVASDSGSADHGVNDTEITLSAEVSIAENPDACKPLGDMPADNPLVADYNSQRCISGTLAFLNVTLTDGEPHAGSSVKKTAVSLATGLNLTSTVSGPVQRVGLRELLNGNVDISLSVTPEANVDLRLHTGLNGLAGFPSLAGAFHLGWTPGDLLDDPDYDSLVISFDHLYLDAGSFVSSFIAPITRNIKKITSPLMPVIDTIRAPLPVLTDLNKLVGDGSDVTLLSIVEALGADTELLNRIIDIIVFANSIPDSATTWWIPLTSGDPLLIDGQKAMGGKPNPGSELSLIKSGLGSVTTTVTLKEQMESPPAGDAEKGKLSATLGKALNTTRGLTFPFIQEPTQVIGLLFGQDITLIHFDAGTLSATAGISYSFPPIMIGPVPLSISLVGSVTLEGHFAMGYDTSGIRRILNGGSAGDLLDGIYIDDLNASGVDVDEIRLIGKVGARAAVDLVIVSAGVGGGIILTFGMDLVDEPEADGKLRIAEISAKLANPWCLFQVRGKLEAYLEAFVEVDFFFFSKEWTWELARITLLEFSAKCSPPNPVVAGGDPAYPGDLILHIGRYKDRRNVNIEEVNEEVTVRQLNNQADGEAKARVSVAMFGIYQEFELAWDKKVRAWADVGSDKIALEPGAAQDGTPIPFTLAAEIYGGAGSDEIRSGDGPDILYGDEADNSTLDPNENHNDKIMGGGGNDWIYGGLGADALDGSFGKDKAWGQEGNDRINGGPDSDELYGGPGDDSITGGPGSNSRDDGPGIAPDLGDYIVGGLGIDTLQGGWGADTIFGDEAGFNPDELDATQILAACEAGGTDAAANDPANRDLISGNEDSDRLFGGDGPDDVRGGPGNDALVCGNGGDDFVDGDDSEDRLENPSDAGNDGVYGGPGNDTLYGRGGNDLLKGGSGHDFGFGGMGRDRIYGQDGSDILLGDGGRILDPELKPGDHVLMAMMDVVALVEAGNAPAEGERIADCGAPVAGPGNADCIFGDDPSDDPGGKDFLFGEGGHDRLYGYGADDYLDGSAGDDWVYGGKGDDVARGGPGDDLVKGEDDDDHLYGDSGGDRLYGNLGNDVIRGGPGDDHLEGNQDSDELYGDAGQDNLIGGSSPDAEDDSDENTPDSGDYLYGGADPDLLAGDNASIEFAAIQFADGVDPADGTRERALTLYHLDQASGDQSGDDFLYGEDGNDDLYGQGGGDTLRGGAGDDYLEGNIGGDFLYGGSGQDDLIGGTSSPNYDDGADELWGADGLDDLQAGDFDVLAGDNAAITRLRNGSGHWVTTTYAASVTGYVLRQVELYNVAAIGGPDVPVGRSGGDALHGEDGYDILYGQGGQDALFGGTGDDYLEGNAGSDTLNGGDGDDDMLGGSGPITAGGTTSLVAGLVDASDKMRLVPLEGNGLYEQPVPFGDLLNGGTGADVMLGDNGRITRPTSAGLWRSQTYRVFLDTPGSAAPRHPLAEATSTRVYREVTMIDAAPGLTAGSDLMYGGPGEDDLYGQYDDAALTSPAIGDELYGDQGDDVLIGDNGLAGSVVVSTTTQNIAPKEPFFEDEIMVEGSLFRPVTLTETPGDGPDRLVGGDGSDWIHGGGGNDLANGSSGNDRVFGGGGNDILWGGPHHDHLWGGMGDDYLDVLWRDSALIGSGGNAETRPADTYEWYYFSKVDNFQDFDLLYGGWGRDAMQADLAPTGPNPGDRMVDWVGAYNIYYLCPAQYGEFSITRDHSPWIQRYLQDLSAGDGADRPDTTGTSGFSELGLVYNRDIVENSHPPHPENPGHFTCEVAVHPYQPAVVVLDSAIEEPTPPPGETPAPTPVETPTPFAETPPPAEETPTPAPETPVPTDEPSTPPVDETSTPTGDETDPPITNEEINLPPEPTGGYVIYLPVVWR